MKIKTVIDIGSNSIKMRSAKINNGRLHILRDETEVVRLGRGMSRDGMLQPENMRITCEAASRMVKSARFSGKDHEIFIVGTQALRTAKNSGDFVKMIKDSTGLDVHIFSGEDEAKFSWLGAVDGFNFSGDVIMFDSGGGSTEFVSGCQNFVKLVKSVPVGAVTLSEKFFADNSSPVKMSACESALEYVKNLFIEHNILSFKTHDANLIGVGGGLVAMASVKFACENFLPSRLHGKILTQRDIMTQIRMYAALNLIERQNIIGLPASRADVILGSACIILAALRLLEADSCIVSINGLRHGLLLRDNIISE